MPERRVPTLTAAALAVLLAASGCTGGARSTPAPTGAPSAAAVPSAACTPASGAPTPCPAEQAGAAQAEAALSARAKETFTRYYNEMAALQRRGGATAATAELSQVAGGPYLAAQLQQLTRLKELQARVGGGNVQLLSLTPVPGAPARGYAVSLRACVDARATTVLQGDKKIGKGLLSAETVFFREDGGVLKIWDAERADPAACG